MQILQTDQESSKRTVYAFSLDQSFFLILRKFHCSIFFLELRIEISRMQILQTEQRSWRRTVYAFFFILQKFHHSFLIISLIFLPELKTRFFKQIKNPRKELFMHFSSKISSFVLNHILDFSPRIEDRSWPHSLAKILKKNCLYIFFGSIIRPCSSKISSFVSNNISLLESRIEVGRKQ